MREKIKEIIPCNLKLEDVLSSGSKFDKFDIIQTNLCLEIVCESIEEFKHTLCKLEKLLKPGGYLLCLTAKGGRWYTCDGAGKMYHQLNLEEAEIQTAFRESGSSCMLQVITNRNSTVVLRLVVGGRGVG